MRVVQGIAPLRARFGSGRRPGRDECLLPERPDHRGPDGARRTHGSIAPEVSMRWWMTRRVERQATRMHEVMERLNVDGAALARVRQGQAYADARARCVM